jgi:outer membrane lipoprotein-sorting protein
MKTPLEKQLEKAYQIFNKDHERMCEKLRNSLVGPQAELEPEPEREYIPERRSSGPKLGEIIMDSRIFKIAAGIVIVAIALIGIKFFGGSDVVTCVAFGDVLNQMKNSSYTFDMTTISEGQAQGTSKGMMLKPGIARFDAPELMGGVTTISNFQLGESMIIFHGQKTVMNMKDVPGAEEMPQDSGPFSILLNPIESLWNLQDGTETSLGEKEIDGQPAVGFSVKKEEKDYSGEINVWANKETGIPIRVEINLHNPDNPSESLSEVISNFNLGVELDEELFSMKPPEGYTLAYQKTLDQTVQKGQSSPEADKIKLSIELWSDGEEDKAVEIILTVDWTKPFNFSGDMYYFYMKEKEIAALKQADQQKVVQEIMDTSSQVRNLCFKLWEEAQAAVSQKQYDKAEKYLNATLGIGRLVNRDPELSYIVQMSGHAIIQKSLTEMEKLYSASGEREKLQQTQQDLKAIITESQSLQEKLKNMSGQ